MGAMAHQAAGYDVPLGFFRRFVLAFYTPWFRDLFFQPAAPPRLFRAVVTILAGHWRPSLSTRVLIEVFFLARLYFGDRAGVLAVALLALYPLNIVLSTILVPEIRTVKVLPSV